MSYWVAGASLVGAIGGGLLANKGAKEAASGADSAADAQLQMYNQTRQDYAPYRQTGNAALAMLAATAGLPAYDATQESIDNAGGGVTDPSKLVKTGKKSDGGRDIYVDPDSGWGYIVATTGNNAGAPVPIGQKIAGYPLTDKAAAGLGAVAAKAGTPTMQYFQASPDYQFRLQQGIQATDRSAASRGLLLSGAQNKAVERYGSDLASGEFGNWWNRISALAGIGQTATAGTAAAGANAASNYGNAAIAKGDARASGYMAGANILNSAGNNLAYYMGTRNQQQQPWGEEY